MDTQIIDIDISMSLSDFESILQTEINKYNSSHSINLSYNIESVATKRGKNMYKTTVTFPDGSDVVLVAEQNDTNGNIMFHPLMLQSFNDSFYLIHFNDPDNAGTYEDPGVFICWFLERLALHKSGTVACMNPNGDAKIISNGQSKRVRSIGLIDDSGTVYSCTSAEKVTLDTGDTQFSVVKPIGDWLNEHKDVQAGIASLPLDQKMNYVGKWLIQARLKEEIDADEFMDIFRQAGVIGYSEPSIIHIYKLIM